MVDALGHVTLPGRSVTLCGTPTEAPGNLIDPNLPMCSLCEFATYTAQRAADGIEGLNEAAILRSYGLALVAAADEFDGGPALIPSVPPTPSSTLEAS